MWRELSANKSRFASVFGIVLLGVMMLSGLLSVGPGMRRAGQAWYSGQNVFDLRVVSTLGLSQDDIDAIAAAEGVEAVMPVKQVDCEGSFRGGSTLAVRVQRKLAMETGVPPEGMRHARGERTGQTRSHLGVGIFHASMSWQVAHWLVDGLCSRWQSKQFSVRPKW